MLDSPAVTSPQEARGRLPQLLEELRELVEIESPTGDEDAIGRIADLLARRLAAVADVGTVELPRWGPALCARRDGAGARVLLLAHADTVWRNGSWPTLWRRGGDRVSGPGVYDMKSGLLLGVWALEALATSEGPAPTVELLVTPDEEVGSPGSRPLIEDAARRADFVLVLEPTVAGQPLKVARKGSGEYVVRIRGRSAHQGVEPEKGVNAVVEAAHQVLALKRLEDLEAGTTVGPNVVRGGTASNVVPEFAELRVDVRAWRASEQRRIGHDLAALRPMLDGAALELDGGWNRPPMETTPLSMALFERARGIAGGLGLDVAPVAWGGSSDANLAAAVGAPTVDGFGPEGGGAHQRTEHVVVDSIPARLALLVHLLRALASPPETWLPPDALHLHRTRTR